MTNVQLQNEYPQKLIVSSFVNTFENEYEITSKIRLC